MIKNRKQISTNSSLVVEFQGFGLKISSSGLLLLKPTKKEQSLARIVQLEMVTPVLRKNLISVHYKPVLSTVLTNIICYASNCARVTGICPLQIDTYCNYVNL